MNITLSGSLGHIGLPLAQRLRQRGHSLTLISQEPARRGAIEALGARAAIGSLDDAEFLTAACRQADALFAMVPPAFAAADPRAYYQRIGRAYQLAIGQAGVPRVVHLSSYGADLAQGTGLILGSHDVEQLLNAVPRLSLTHLRPAYFYNNLFAFIEGIRTQGEIRANYGGDQRLALVAPADIAAVAVDALETPTGFDRVRYVSSDEQTGDEIARVLGEAVGLAELRWHVISDAAMRSQLAHQGVPTPTADALIELFACLHRGARAADYTRHRPAQPGTVKLADFAREFAAVYAR